MPFGSKSSRDATIWHLLTGGVTPVTNAFRQQVL